MGDGSLGYAGRLSHRDDLGGELGAPELQESAGDLAAKAAKLAQMIAESEHIVAFTGAGISTSCGIPDFRGPDGVWTRQRRGEELPKASLPFEHARPSLTHMALVALQRSGKLKYLISQNVDSLHLRSGIPRAQLAELHGNCFAERCSSCAREYVRDFEVNSVGFKPTGRVCDGCRGYLMDHCLDWDDELPADELALSERHASKADLVLCLGTSLIITPACDIPLLALRKRKTKPKGGRVAIVNLQATPVDPKAALVAHARVDEVMGRAMALLRIPVPCYCRIAPLLVTHDVQAALPATAGGRGTGATSSEAGATTTLVIELRSAHGADCPLPWLSTCSITFAHTPDASPHLLHSPCRRLELPLPSVRARPEASHPTSLAPRPRVSGCQLPSHISPGPLPPGRVVRNAYPRYIRAATCTRPPPCLSPPPGSSPLLTPSWRLLSPAHSAPKPSLPLMLARADL